MSEEKSNNSTLSDPIREKSIRLFTYLRELAKLRTKTIRTLDNYESVLWFSDVPREPECFTQAWGASEDGREEIWLEIKKPKLLHVPPVPNELQPWVSRSELENSSKDEPELLQRIPAPVEKNMHSEEMEDSQPTIEPQFLELSDHLHLLDIWADYIEKKWKPWAKEHGRLKKVQEVYSELFTIYQKQKSLGEALEVVIGLGLLCWQTPHDQRVYRHLITTKAAIEFEPNVGTLSVVPPAEGSEPMLEQDMLEPSECPNRDVLPRIEQQVNELADDIWNTESVEAVLRSYVQSVSAEGDYSGELAPSGESSTKPFVTYSPALILRKRTERSLIRVYDEIIKQLTAGVKIPIGVERMVETKDDRQGDDYDPGDSIKPCNFREILFPLPANDEQLQIIENLNTRQGVLVQGPPGTGKSHTIVNLICHLLATGQRVLVTSHTARALKVLKEKILKEEGSEEMAALCVSLLGIERSALDDLEKSVQGITNRYDNWNPQKNSQEISELRQELDELQRLKATLNGKLREIREHETYEHNMLNGMYRGTAQQIAQQVSAEQPKYGWLQMEIAPDKEPPLTNEEAMELLRLYRELTPERENEIEKPAVSLKELPTPEEFVRLCDEETLANERHKPFASFIQPDALIYKKLKDADTCRRKLLQEALNKLLTARANVLNQPQQWVGEAVNDILSGLDQKWQELYKKSSENLAWLPKEARVADELQLNLPQGYDRATIKNDAMALLEHLNKGGGFGFPCFRPKPVKSARYLWKEIKVNDQLCDNVDSLKAFLAMLTVDEQLDKLWSYWKPCASRVEGSRSVQIRELENLCKPLKAALDLYGLVEDVKARCANIEGLPFPAWHNVKEIEYYQRMLDGILSEEKLEHAQASFKQAEQNFRKAMTNPNVHPVVKEGRQALLERDEQAYGMFYHKISALYGDRKKLELREEFCNRLKKSAPTIADHLATDSHKESWNENLAHFNESWRWAQANTWLKEHIAGANEAQLSEEIQEVQNKIGVTTGRLASAQAWENCFNHMKEPERRSLIAWKQAMGRIGRGKGKRVEIHRRDARRNMEGCRSAIPAWIMPLYRVAETLNPARDAYDVVIIDEASQAGIDALFLLFIAKKIIVVGDDMQISPESIGVSREEVDLLREQYIKDLPPQLIGSLGVEETSLFHIAEILFGGRISLKEHFRCMPEIIQFSNLLCYQSKPLIPLRQYPPNRLTPVVIARHVPDGYREGDTRTPRNPPEAQAIADTIAKCCKDPAYKDKTMGVISLLGELQARLIERKLIEVIGPEEMERRNLICGDAYAFQGDERDVMFLSLVASPEGDTIMRALTGQKGQRRFNVAASRARDQMWLFHTPTINDFRNKECMRYRLLSYCQNPKVQPYEGSRDKCESKFERDVYDKIIGRGYRVHSQFEVAGYFIDLVVEGMRGRLAVECDGDEWHGPDRYEYDMKRQRILERCGWTFWRIRGSEFYYNPDMAMESLWSYLKKHRIAPGGQDIETTDCESSGNSQTKSGEPKGYDKPTNTGTKDEELSEILEAILAVLPPQGKMKRDKAIRTAAKLLKEKGRFEFQRVRKNGKIWNEFKSAINSGIRSGLLEGDAKTIWRGA